MTGRSRRRPSWLRRFAATGYDVVQTTVSRDIAELGLVKVRAPSGRLVYAAPGLERRRPPAGRRCGHAPVCDRCRGRREPRRRDDPVRLRERARAGDRRGPPPEDRGHARGRQHDLRGATRRACARPRCARSSPAISQRALRSRLRQNPSHAPRRSLVVTRHEDGAHEPLGRPRGGGARPGGVGVPARRRPRAAPVRLRGDVRARPAPARRRASSPTEELAEVEARLAEIAHEPGRATSRRTRTCTRAIERQLGEVGRKIHAGRSRNDQVAAALRLYVLDAAPRRARRSTRWRWSMLSFAEAEADTLMPGYTHLQRGQPVTLGHHLLAWVEMLDRDRGRFAHAAEAAAASPLGAGALAGSTLGLPAPAGPDAELDRRGRGPGLRARLPVRGDRALHAPVADRRGARALVDGGVRVCAAAGDRRHRARR